MSETTKIDDGGAAFPFVSHGGIDAHQYFSAGMTMRDWFAGQALAGIQANDRGYELTIETAALMAFTLADAMLKERAEAPDPPAPDLLAAAKHLVSLIDAVDPLGTYGDEADRVFPKYEFNHLRDAIAKASEPPPSADLKR